MPEVPNRPIALVIDKNPERLANAQAALSRQQFTVETIDTGPANPEAGFQKLHRRYGELSQNPKQEIIIVSDAFPTQKKLAPELAELACGVGNFRRAACVVMSSAGNEVNHEKILRKNQHAVIHRYPGHEVNANNGLVNAVEQARQNIRAGGIGSPS